MIRDLKIELTRLLKPLVGTGSMAFRLLPDSANYPRIQAWLPNLQYQEGQYYGLMDIDVWDNSMSTAVIDELADNIISTLDREYHNGNIAFACYLNSLNDVGSEDKALLRYTLTFYISIRRK